MVTLTFARYQDNLLNLDVENLHVTVQGTTSLTVAWTENSQASYYEVDWGINSQSNITDAFYEIINLTKGTQYDIRVRVHTNEEIGDWTDILSVYTLGDYDPTGFSLTDLGDSVLLNWDTPLMYNATHVDIFKRETAILDPFNPAIDTPYIRVPVGQTSFIDLIHSIGDVTYQLYPVKIETGE